MSNTQVRIGIGARRTGTFARLAAIALAAVSSVAGARPVTIGNAALPPPAPPGGVGASGYYGTPGGGWANEAAANQQGFMRGSRYDPRTGILTLGNQADATRVKHLWMRIEFDRDGGYPPPGARPGSPFNQEQWAVASTTAGQPFNPSGASWVREARGGRQWLALYQTWERFPQPAGETINMNNIIRNLPRNTPITSITAYSICAVPTPGSVVLGSLGLVMAARRRRR